MDNRIHDIFDQVHAEDALKTSTIKFLRAELGKRGRPKRVYLRARLAAAFASVALLLSIGGFSSYHLYFTASAYVDLDVNPSIELVVNRFGRVIQAEAYNDDGAAVLEHVSVRHMRYDNAVDTLIDVMAADGYIAQDSLLSVTVQANDQSSESSMVGSLQSTISSSLQTHHASAATNVFPVSEEVKTHAHENHMTPALYLAITELQSLDPTATFEECRSHTISEINQMIQAHGGEHHGSTAGTGGGEHGGGHH